MVFLLGLLYDWQGCVFHKQNFFMTFLVVRAAKIRFFLSFFKLCENFLYKSLLDLFVVDLLEKKGLNARFQINYVLLSVFTGQRLVLRFFASSDHVVDSVMEIFPSAGWLEREMWDMFGVFFLGHLDLRRILTDYGFVGFPLRKDFPLVGFVEVRFDEGSKKLISEPIRLLQEYRYFDFLTPWEKL